LLHPPEFIRLEVKVFFVSRLLPHWRSSRDFSSVSLPEMIGVMADIFFKYGVAASKDGTIFVPFS